MKTFKKNRFMLLPLIVLMAGVIAVPTMSIAAQETVDLGTTSIFAVLAGTTITNTGSTTIDGNTPEGGGNVGLYPGTAFTGQGPGADEVTMTGWTVYLSDLAGVASMAKDDLVTAYDDAAGRTPATTIAAELGGQTLTPGTYFSASGFEITGTLTLDAEGDPNAVFVFQTGDSTLITADAITVGVSNSDVVLINSARFCRVFWQVGSSATLGTYSNFVGHIFAMQSITAKTGATVEGQLLARNGAVTLDTNTITNGFCKTITSSSGGGSSSRIYPPLINVIKTPDPLALTLGEGLVTYTYKVTNPGQVTLSDVSVSDDKISTVNYVSGDVNDDNLLQTSETWIYTGKMTLIETTTNTATAEGSANGLTATDIAYATVVVTPAVVVYPPLINVIKTPDPLALASGGGSVTYTYKVTNPGKVTLSDVSVIDNKVSPVYYVSGDVNADNLLQTSETWIYTGKATLTETTTNTATAKGSANGMTAVDLTYVTVIVPPSVVVTETVTGGQLPPTSTPLYEFFLLSAVLMLLGVVGWRSRKQ